MYAGSSLAAGFDLRSAYKYTIPAGGKAAVSTDIQINLPKGTYGRITARSGLAFVHHISVGYSVLDPDYTGNVVVLLFNHGDKEFKVLKGMRVALLVCEKLEYPEVLECPPAPEECTEWPFGPSFTSTSPDDSGSETTAIAQSGRRRQDEGAQQRDDGDSRSNPPPSTTATTPALNLDG